MSKTNILRQYLALIIVVCLFAGLALSYKVFASEKTIKEENVVEEGTSPSVETMEEVKEELERKVIETFVEVAERKLAPLMNQDEIEREEEKKQAEKKKAKAKNLRTENAFSIQMTEDDLNNLYRLVQSEVGYMDEKSKLLVASVVLNRVNHSKFPDTVSGVVLQKLGKVYQFSPVAPGKRFWTCTVSKETKAAVDKVLKKGDFAKGALYFVAKKYTTRVRGSWFDRNLTWLSHHEGQDYYKER